MSRPLGFIRRQEPLGRILQTPSAESGNATFEVLTQGAGIRTARATQVRAGYKRTEAGVIPEDWGLHDLRTDVSLLSGHHVMAQDYNDCGVGLPYLTGPTDFPDGRIRHTKFTTKPTTLCRAGDILVTVKGSGSGTLVEADAEYCISRQLMAIRTSAWDPTFLRYSLLQNASRIKAASTGLIPGLSRSDILDQYIPIPNGVAEQRAIAAVLTDADALIGSLEALIAKKRAIKRAAMQQLLTGRTRLPGFRGEWSNASLGALAEIRNGGTPRTTVGEYWDGDIPWCTPTDITAAQGRNLVSTARRITTMGLSASGATLLPKGALLLCSRATVGEVRIAAMPVATNQGFKSLVCGKSVDHEYLYYCLLTLKEQMVDLATGSTFLEISKRDVANIRFLLPPLAEQCAIATVLTDMDAEIAALGHHLDKTRSIKQGMMQQLLTGAIRLPIPDNGLEGESYDA